MGRGRVDGLVFVGNDAVAFSRSSHRWFAHIQRQFPMGRWVYVADAPAGVLALVAAVTQ